METPRDPTDPNQQQRIDALRQLADDIPASAVSQAAPSHVPVSHPLRQRPRWLMPLALALILAMLAGIGYVTLPFFHSRMSMTPPIPDTLTIDLDSIHLDCPSSVLWAPGGRRVAVFGDQCGGSQQALPQPLLAIFDARTGKTLKTFDLSTLLPAYGMFTLVSSIAWSPDGVAVAAGLSWKVTLTHGGHRVLPLPDAAFETVLRAVQQSEAVGASVSWSPDGRTLATVLPTDQFPLGGSQGKATFVTLLDTVTGQPIRQFRYMCPTFVSYTQFTGCRGDTSFWSPTGAQIALLIRGRCN